MTAFNLLGKSTTEASNVNTVDITRPRTHLYTKLQLLALRDPVVFDARVIPGEIYNLLEMNRRTSRYMPLFYLDELAFMRKHLAVVDATSTSVNVTLVFQPVGAGKLRMHEIIKNTLGHVHDMGFTEKDTDDVSDRLSRVRTVHSSQIRGLFTDTNIVLLCVTMAVAAVHLLLDVLAFKNDISFWRDRKDMVGLSMRTQIWNCVSHSVIAGEEGGLEV